MDIGHSSQTETSSSSTLSKVIQESLDKFVPNTVSVAEERSSGTFPVNGDLLASKISKLVLEGLKPSRRGKNAASIAVSISNSPRRQVKASNLLEFVGEAPDFSILGEENSYVLRCTSCHIFLSNPLAVTKVLSRKTSGSTFGSLATGLHIENSVYYQLVVGHCEKWHQKKEKCSAICHRRLTS